MGRRAMGKDGKDVGMGSGEAEAGGWTGILKEGGGEGETGGGQ